MRMTNVVGEVADGKFANETYTFNQKRLSNYDIDMKLNS